MPNLMPIGQFSRITGLPARTLRFYDEIGLLQPAVVDPVTGHRYYLPSQVERAHQIARLRSVQVHKKLPSLLRKGSLQTGEFKPEPPAGPACAGCPGQKHLRHPGPGQWSKPSGRGEVQCHWEQRIHP